MWVCGFGYGVLVRCADGGNGGDGDGDGDGRSVQRCRHRRQEGDLARKKQIDHMLKFYFLPFQQQTETVG